MGACVAAAAVYASEDECLAICRLLVARYGGTLALQANAAQGLVVDVTLPVAATATALTP